jgi:hypothetical protein
LLRYAFYEKCGIIQFFPVVVVINSDTPNYTDLKTSSKDFVMPNFVDIFPVDSEINPEDSKTDIILWRICLLLDNDSVNTFPKLQFQQ